MLHSRSGRRFVYFSLAAAVLTSPVSGQTINETQKLVPLDGNLGRNFGDSVSISGDVAVIGSPQDIDAGTNTGSAHVYRFDGASWQEEEKLLASDAAPFASFGFSMSVADGVALVGTNAGSAYIFRDDGASLQEEAKLLPSDSEVNNNFGQTVAVSGDVAVVGAKSDDSNGFRNGSVYVFRFDGTNWSQEAELFASDGQTDDLFGSSVAISGDTLVVGAVGDDDNGSFSGSAYIFQFDGTNWLEDAKLLAADGAAADEFGSVAISGDAVVIGARSGNNGPVNTGAAYVFRYDGTNWTQEAKLLADDGQSNDFFGWGSVSVDGDAAVVGAVSDDDNGSYTGSAYLFRFDGTDWNQESKLLAADGAEQDYFGDSISISGNAIVTGAPRDDDNGAFSGSAYIFNIPLPEPDTDGDGLLDDWEFNGIPYTDTLGKEQRYILPGSDAFRKNLYVEVDAMTGFSLSPVAISDLVVAFGLAPVMNPDGSTGIDIHILSDDTDLPLYNPWVTINNWPDGGVGQLSFQEMRNAHYGTTAERTDPSATALLEAKAMAYRYCVFAVNADVQIGGTAKMPGDEFVIFAAGYPDEGQAAVFMHELGHNLGLGHGGCDDINGKPNYPSIMNYLLTFKQGWNEDFWRLDYSRQSLAFDILDESSLNENSGIGTAGDEYDDFFMPFGVNELDGMGNTVRTLKYAALNGSAVDFGDTTGTGFLDDIISTGVEQDLNYAVNPPMGITLPSAPSPNDELRPHNDWLSIGLKLAAAIGPSAPAPVIPTGELTNDAIAWMDNNFPDPPSDCLADVNHDGMVTPTDFTAWINAFNNQLPECDQNSDGSCTPTDFTAWIANFNAGCP